MSLQEKSIWISLVVTLLIFGYYFASAFRVFSDPAADQTKLIGLFIGAVVLMIIIEAVLHIVLAIAFKREAEKSEDERDKVIDLRARRISYFVLSFGVWTMGISVLVDASPLELATIMMFFFILAEAVGFSTQLFYYRRGI